MTITINLDEIEFYKEDYESTGKIYLTGSITGLDSTKQYCVWWTCDMCTEGMYLHRGSLDYFFIDKKSSASFGDITHLHTSDIVWSTGDYSVLGVYIIEVDGTCENYISSVLADTSLIVYHDYEYPPEETGILSCKSVPTGAKIYLNDEYYGLTNMDITLDPGQYNIKFTKDGYEDFTEIRTIVAGETSYISKTLVPITKEGFLEMVSGSFEFTDMTATPVTEAPEGQEIQVCFDVKNTGESTDNFYVSVEKDNVSLSIDTFSLNVNETKSIYTNTFIMDTSDIDIIIFTYHDDESIDDYIIDKTYTKTLYYKVPEFCTQYFRIEDQDGNPLKGSITSPSWDIDLGVPNTGEASTTLQKGISYTFTAYVGTKTKTSYIVACTDTVETYVFDIPVLCTQVLRILDQDGNLIDGIFYCEYFGEVSTENGKYEFEVNPFQTLQITAHYNELSIVKNVTTCTPIPEDFIFDIEEPEFGKIGEITYNIIKQIGNDEITFYIPVTNLTDKEQCFYVNLMNPDDETEVLEKAPNVPLIGRIADRIPAGDTEIIELSSTWDVRWNINNVLGKIVKFELRHSEPVLDALGVVICNPLKSAYDVVDEVSVDLSATDIIINLNVDNTMGLVTKDLKAGLLYSDPTTLTKTDVCGSPIDIIDVTPNIFTTSWTYPGPFTCSGKAYPADSMFVVYARGYDDKDNEYVITSRIFRSVYGTKEVTLKITGEPIEECFIDHPTDPTKCLITMEQWKVIKWGGIVVGGLYIANIVSPFVKGAGEGLKALTSKDKK